jgi:hypothetical protein
VNFLERFHSLVGSYNLTNIKQADNGDWSCTLYRGRKKIGAVIATKLQAACNTSWVADHLTLDVQLINSEEDQLLSKWADQAGPLGFESKQDFLAYIIICHQLLVKMRDKARAGYLVAVNKNAIDDHGMPGAIAVSHTIGAATWRKAYAKANPDMIVMNDIVLR